MTGGGPPVVSVIIPSYNRAHLVGQAVDSVLQHDVRRCGSHRRGRWVDRWHGSGNHPGSARAVRLHRARRLFDFLSGDEAYKYRWATAECGSDRLLAWKRLPTRLASAGRRIALRGLESVLRTAVHRLSG